MDEQKKKIVFIINPVSGIGRHKKAESAILKHLDHSKYSFEIAYTDYAHHAAEIAKSASRNGFNVVVSIGGDGSANDVAQGLVHSETIMGLIPVGSGNGLAHHLKIPISLKKAIGIINKLKISRIDTATINDKLFISVAGLGFDALVAEEFARCGRRGFWSYLKNGMKQFISYKPAKYRLRFEGKEIDCNAMLVSFANSDQFGYNVRIAPGATVYDGFIDLTIIKPISFFSAALMAHRFFLKSVHRSRHVEVHKIKEAHVEISEDVSCHVDGDPVERTHSATVRIVPKSLNIIIP
ncbi:MAG: diacylglycerol kinase family protein [Bacteroidota bacterium]